MKEVAVRQEQYTTYILSDRSADAALEIVPERGGIVTRWRLNNRDILYLDAERFAKPEMSIRGGIPILFPICGNLPDNTYTYQGKQYTLKQHGFARDLPWDVTDQNDTDELSLTLTLTSSDRTRAVYPFDFTLTFTYVLAGDRLEIRQRYHNHSSEPMPMSTGLHPYFAVTDKSQLRFNIPAEQYQDQITKEQHSYTGGFDFSQDEIDIAFRPISRQSASFTESPLQINLTWDSAYSTLVFWTVKGKDYICLEPWSAPRNALNTGESLIGVKPGATLETRVQIQANFL